MNEENNTIQHQIESTSAELKKAEDIYTDFSIKYTEKYNEIEKACSHFGELCWGKSESTRKKLGQAVVNRRNKMPFLNL